MLFCTPFARPSFLLFLFVALFLLFDLLFLLLSIVLLLLFDLLFHSSCSICCSTPFTQLLVLFLLNLLHSSCSSYHTPLAWPPCLNTFTPCSWFCRSTPLARPFCLGISLLCSWFCCSLLLLLDLATLLLLFQIDIYHAPFLFCRCVVWKSYPNLSSSNSSF